MGNFYRHTSLQNKTGVLFMCINFGLVPGVLKFKLWKTLIALMLVQVIHVACLVLNRMEFRTISRILFVLDFYFACCLASWVLSPKSGARYFTFPTVVVWVLLTPVDSVIGSSHVLRIGAPTVVSVFAWAILFYFDDPFHLREEISPTLLDNLNDLYLRPLGLCIGFFSVSCMVWWVKMSSASSEKMIGEEHDVMEVLLNDLLPESIVARLKSGERHISECQPLAAIMFFNIVDFTRMSSNLDAAGLVSGLGKVFHTLDGMVEEHSRVEKIKTIGDAYMVGAGVLSSKPSREDVVAVVELALQIRDAKICLEYVNGRGEVERMPLQFRFGIHVGEVISGVITQKRLLFDVFGDTVNIASRMESESEPGMITCSQLCMRMLEGEVKMRSRGQRQIKGKGKMKLYEILDKKPMRYEMMY